MITITHVLLCGLCLSILLLLVGQVEYLSCDRARLPGNSSIVARSIDGLTLVAPPEPFSADPIAEIKEVGADWIAVVPYAFARRGDTAVRYPAAGWQWWGERPEGVCETIRMAHAAGLRVMLKPQVYIPGGWTGELSFADETSWQAWERAYARYIFTMVRIADSLNVELFCIGTEFRQAIAQRPAFWSALIAQVRQRYKGLLTYSANWDDWQEVPFWEQLDYVGVSAYFPLVEADTPTLEALRAAWRPYVEELSRFSQRWRKPVLFTEFGYLSVNGAGGRTWELEKDIQRRPVNEVAQANCLDALFSTFKNQSWWAGGFLWKWFPNMRGHEGYPERDYSPQGKLAMQVLRRWYRRE
ncbi:MAG: hypothetical protein NZM43_00540 [Saprospiraceae bacterium]|nr:hypothetical protein [Saprospiraceae bacterium]MDW8482789.1 hypothetical protein [Saprospiraceae bacterium]